MASTGSGPQAADLVSTVAVAAAAAPAEAAAGAPSSSAGPADAAETQAEAGEEARGSAEEEDAAAVRRKRKGKAPVSAEAAEAAEWAQVLAVAEAAEVEERAEAEAVADAADAALLHAASRQHVEVDLVPHPTLGHAYRLRTLISDRLVSEKFVPMDQINAYVGCEVHPPAGWDPALGTTFGKVPGFTVQLHH